MLSLITFISVVKEWASCLNLKSHASKIDEVKVHIWRVILWEFKNNKNATETAKKIFSVHGQNIIYWSPCPKLVFKVSCWRYVIEILSRTRRLITLRSRSFKWIHGMQSVQNYSTISTWSQHTPIQNQEPLENYGKSERARRLGSFYF